MTELNLYGEEERTLTDLEQDKVQYAEAKFGQEIIGYVVRKMMWNEGKQKHVTDATLRKWAMKQYPNKVRDRFDAEQVAEAARLKAESGDMSGTFARKKYGRSAMYK